VGIATTIPFLAATCLLVYMCTPLGWHSYGDLLAVPGAPLVRSTYLRHPASNTCKLGGMRHLGCPHSVM
jgi:hypothetical protein